MAACVPLNIKFFGASAHAALRVGGIDAIAMAYNAYGRLQKAVADIAGETKYIWSVGRFCGGTAHNVIAEFCEMDITFRFYDMEFADRVKESVFNICENVAAEFGGRTEIDWNMSTGAVHNDADITECFRLAAEKCGADIVTMPQRMSSEDIGWFLTKSKGMIFQFGTRNEALGCTSLLHKNDFKIDELGMKTAIEVFLQYVLSL